MMNNKRICTLSLLLLTAVGAARSQAPGIEWQNTIGGISADYLRTIISTTDGGYLAGGYSSSGISGDKSEANMGADYWIVKTDGAGNLEWEETIGGSGGDYLYAVLQTTDGGYLLGGYSDSGISGDKTDASVGFQDYWIVKTDASGGIEWQKTVGGNNLDLLFTVIETSDGGYLLGGYSSSGISGDKTEAGLGQTDFWVVKVYDTGSVEWQNTIGGSGWDYLYSMVETSDGGFLLGGGSDSPASGDKTDSSLGNDYWIVKIDGSGSVLWENTIGGIGTDYLYTVVETDDDGFLLGGYSYSGIGGDKTEASFGEQDFWIIKTNDVGVIEWQKTIGGDDTDILRVIVQADDGGYVLGGYSASGISGNKSEDNYGLTDFWVVKTDASGNVEWDKTIGGGSTDNLYALSGTPDGGYVLGGHSSSGVSGSKDEESMGGYDYWMVKLEGPFMCNTPTGLSVEDLTSMTATLSWDDAGADATAYKFQLLDISTASRFNLTLAPGTTSISMGPAALSPGVDYAFRLRGLCSDGSRTAWSAPYFSAHPCGCPEHRKPATSIRILVADNLWFSFQACLVSRHWQKYMT